MYRIIQKRKIWLTISSLLVVISLVALFAWGLNYGIDFTGGSLLEVKFSEDRPEISEVYNGLSSLNMESLIVQPVGEDEMILRFQDISEETHQVVLQELNNIVGHTIEVASSSATSTPISTVGQIEELRYDSVGPSIGRELKTKSIYAIIAVLICIVLYIAFTFRKVSKPVASWKYGLTAIVALFHDVFVVLGIFAFLGHYYGVEINTAFVAAILTVLGYSVNDTIVVFDRIRENLPKSEDDFEGTVNASVNQTITRSINTSITTLIVLLSILFFGGSTIRDFVLALSAGVIIGTYSSIFLASPLLVAWERRGNK